MSKKTIKVDVSPVCVHALPCYHYCTYTYSDGTYEICNSSGIAIYEYFDILSDEDKKHFKGYEYYDRKKSEERFKHEVKEFKRKNMCLFACLKCFQ